MSQERLAELAEIDQTYLSGVERGRRNIGIRNVFRILVFTARSSQVQKDPGAYAAFVKAYAAAVSKMEKDRAWAAQMATQSGLAGSVSAAALQIELDQYLGPQDKPCTGIWSCTGAFNEAMYNEGKKLLTGSGFFPETDFPTFQQLTQYAPKT